MIKEHKINMEFATATTATAAIKNTGYVALFVLSVEYLGITPISLVILTCLIITDVATGILKSAAIHGWVSIRSSVFQRGIIAKCLLIVAPLSLAVAGKGIGFSTSVLAQSVLNLLILSETYSIFGNINAVRTGEEKAEFDAVAFVLSKVRETLKKIIIDDEKPNK
jgi:toxin secretion/phage lysis holin